MFFAEAQIRVHLYGQPTDMRKYAGRFVMHSIDWLHHGYPVTDPRVALVRAP